MQALGIDSGETKLKISSHKYCIACKKRAKNVDCSRCSRKFEVEKDVRRN